MIKKSFILSTMISAIMLTGCGEDTSPKGALIAEIDKQSLQTEEDVSKLLHSYYKRSKNNVKKEVCSTLDTSSDNALDISIIELSKKHCKNIPALKSEFKTVISEINKVKSMNIRISDIDETADFIKANFDKELAKEFVDADISVEDAINIYENSPYNDNTEADMFLIKNGTKTLSEIKVWHKKGARSLKSLKEWHKIGVTTAQEFSQWRALGIGVKCVSDWKTAGLKTPKEVKQWRDIKIKLAKYYQKFKEAGLSYEDVAPWTKIGMRYPEQITLAKELSLTPELAKKYNLQAMKAHTVKDYIAKGIKLENFDGARQYSSTRVMMQLAELRNEKDYNKLISFSENTGIYYPSEYQGWMDIKVTDENELRIWKKELILKHSSVKKLKKIGLNTPDEFQSFLKQHNINAGKVFKAFRYLPEDKHTMDDVKEYLKL